MDPGRAPCADASFRLLVRLGEATEPWWDPAPDGCSSSSDGRKVTEHPTEAGQSSIYKCLQEMVEVM